MAKQRLPGPSARAERLTELRNRKMARSAHRYVRGSTAKFYEWLQALRHGSIPEGPRIWVCGDCHVGNLGPLANAAGDIEIQIRDFDQTVVGNPAVDLIRLSLSLASAARGSDLPGVVTARMLERIMVGYRHAFEAGFDIEADLIAPKPVHAAIRQSRSATWKTLAQERIEDTSPTIPLGKRYWPLSAAERRELKKLAGSEDLRRLVTALRSRENGVDVRFVDAAYWVKGCSSLGRLRYALIVAIDGNDKGKPEYCLIDVKQAVKADAPREPHVRLPRQPAQRVVDGVRRLSPYLGKRMFPAHLMNRSVFVRELLPQDLKLEVEQLGEHEALETACYLAAVVGKAHGRQMDAATRSTWLRELAQAKSRSLDAPTWLWTNTVDLLALHEKAYLEHCRRYALREAGRK
jgi:uncharacterized protein (DUF2252 family)